MSWQVVIAALVVALALVTSNAAARRTGAPYPVFLVVAGVLISLFPGVTVPALHPGVVFYGFLPPLVYGAAFLASPGEFAANWAPIGLLAVGLVLATTAIVAAVAHVLIPGLDWAPAFVLGAIVAPTDPVAAGEVIRRVGAPRRIITILEGESLINDGVALALYALAVSASVSGGVTVLGGVAELVRIIAIAIAIGAAVGVVARFARRRLTGPDAQVVLSLVTPYVAYIAADHLDASGVLATVTAGLIVGWRTEGLVSAPARLRAMTFWDVATYLLNAILFLLLGARFESVVQGVSGVDDATLAVEAAAAVGAVILTRMVWNLYVPLVVARVRSLTRGGATLTSRPERLLVGWSGMRGAISLAAALSIPLQASGKPFPDRALIVFVTFAVILGTLVFQGASMPLVVNGLGLVGVGQAGDEEARARAQMAEAALSRLDELIATEEATRAEGRTRLSAEDLTPLRRLYESRLERARAQLEGSDEGERGDDGSSPLRRQQRIDAAWREVIGAARAELHRLERTGEVDNETMLRLQRELDLEETRRHR